ncbi:uncharacterized protein LOC121909452 isoform X1 [Thunnus maccoyii]|uniref:uncharacterized protein LOC121909452 isoform X1 n=1 Tax=Thunnus maccoyii TaxID=8240 RepID=UPI001C4D4F3D|nr:uncharacterized protein LOC121909452 isoform X1 [Thunnus maccoyii]
MDRLHIFLLIVTGVVFCSHDGISGSVLEVTVRPGDNITLYCDCKTSPGVFIVWFRNCSHMNQPSLVLRTKYEGGVVPRDSKEILNPFPHFHLLKNQSFRSYDLLIMNITDSDEGLYYCGTERNMVEDKTTISLRKVYSYGNATRITVNSSDSSSCPVVSVVPAVSWIVMLTPAFTVFSSLFSFILVYHLNHKTDKDVHQKKLNTRGQTRGNQDEDLCLTRVVFQAQHGQTHQ